LIFRPSTARAFSARVASARRGHRCRLVLTVLVAVTALLVGVCEPTPFAAAAAPAGRVLLDPDDNYSRAVERHHLHRTPDHVFGGAAGENPAGSAV